MKTLQYSLLLCTLSGMAITACASDRFTPVESPNPWQDDYTEFAVVDRQDKWGTYNVHDPAVTRVGDTYYMYSTDAIYFARPKEPVDSATRMQEYQRGRRLGEIAQSRLTRSGKQRMGALHGEGRRRNFPPILLLVGFRTQDFIYRTGHGHFARRPLDP